MVYYKLIIAYDGTNYQGWQQQNNGPTICGELKKTFKSIFKKDISIVGASRTDAGVHADFQVARIRTELNIDPEHLKKVWNRGLSRSILIKVLEKISEDFHPQRNVKQKTYKYKVFKEIPSPFVQRYGLFYDYSVDIKKLKKSLKFFVGEHDFRSFCTGYEMDSTIRSIDSIKVRNLKKENAFEIVFKGKSFLRYMIRRIAGACLEVASNRKLDITVLKVALDEKSPQQNLPTAPSKGLMLCKIDYV